MNTFLNKTKAKRHTFTLLFANNNKSNAFAHN